MNRDHRLSILREHENDCYAICLMILRSEDMAVRAAKNALLQLWTHDDFLRMDANERPGVLRRVCMRSALQLRAAADHG
ncbi:hypothetical protein SAMN02799630_03816 [Paenibacillus sp. UNCCL117]|uniref:hypothetical protein n=1 Tax=unclassified Paenibacillus TaxID=185978 RepID=UPI00088454DC|nr:MULTISPECIES: hypothetical protein [unclassified Paenibacillus]SDD59047.1 hypothetical protein SAMN04488602_110121 [Paenibacillus sp. cl123]SFW50894.1 hypothetical protein SAMN02799630_03816 [Paenibacillus sp. UNCCL117]